MECISTGVRAFRSVLEIVDEPGVLTGALPAGTCTPAAGAVTALDLVAAGVGKLIVDEDLVGDRGSRCQEKKQNDYPAQTHHHPPSPTGVLSYHQDITVSRAHELT